MKYEIDPEAAAGVDPELFRAAMAEIPKPKADRIKTSAIEPLLEHVQARGYDADRELAERGWIAHGLPLFVDETVEPGWIEVWLRDELVDRFRIA